MTQTSMPSDLSRLPQALSIRQSDSRKSITLRLNVNTLAIESKYVKEIVYRQVIAVYFNRDTQLLEVSYLDRKKQTASLSLVKVAGVVQDSKNDVVSAWVETLLHASYDVFGVERSRRLKVLVNPFGGVGKGATIFVKKIEPIFKAARCSMDVVYTTHHGHAFDIAKEIDFNYDAIVTVSGDGLIHEVMNGFANHKDPRSAFSIPIAPIPTGSGNGLSLNLLGIQGGIDVGEAALNVIKGRLMKVDVFSLIQNGKRTISFMSQALGLMADLDIGTEHLRWMGDARFMVGLMRGLIPFKPCPIQLSVKVAEDDKRKMVQAMQLRHNETNKSISSLVTEDVTSGAMPPLKYSIDDTDGWITIDEPILYLYAGKGPYVGRGFMAFPVSQPNDGLIDLTVHLLSSRREILKCLGGAHKGETFWINNLRYFKAHAYRVKPFTTKGVLSVDGEHFDFEEFQVEAHPGLATVLSPHGYYAADCPPEPSSDHPPRGDVKRKK